MSLTGANLLIFLVFAGIGLLIQYAIIKTAVVHAIREVLRSDLLRPPPRSAPPPPSPPPPSDPTEPDRRPWER